MVTTQNSGLCSAIDTTALVQSFPPSNDKLSVDPSRHPPISLLIHACTSKQLLPLWVAWYVSGLFVNLMLKCVFLSVLFFMLPLQLAPSHSVVVDLAPVPEHVGSLPVEWDLQRVGDMGVGVEVENWVEPSRPRNDREKLHDFIVQEGLLQLHPPVGRLGPGESTTWTILYRQACVAALLTLSMLWTSTCVAGSLRTPSLRNSSSCMPTVMLLHCSLESHRHA